MTVRPFTQFMLVSPTYVSKSMDMNPEVTYLLRPAKNIEFHSRATHKPVVLENERSPQSNRPPTALRLTDSGPGRCSSVTAGRSAGLPAGRFMVVASRFGDLGLILARRKGRPEVRKSRVPIIHFVPFVPDPGVRPTLGLYLSLSGNLIHEILKIRVAMGTGV